MSELLDKATRHERQAESFRVLAALAEGVEAGTIALSFDVDGSQQIQVAPLNGDGPAAELEAPAREPASDPDDSQAAPASEPRDPSPPERAAGPNPEQDTAPARDSEGAPAATRQRTIADRVLEAMDEIAGDGRWVRASELVKATGASDPGVKHALRTLRQHGRLATRGKGAGMRYALPGLADEASPVEEEDDPPPDDDPPAAASSLLDQRTKAAPGALPDDHPDRLERQRQITTDERSVLAWIRERGEVTAEDLAGHLGVSVEQAKRKLAAYCKQTSKTRVEKYGKTYRMTASVTDDDGAKTGAERRVVAAIRESQPIDEATLAFHSQTTVVELRSIASGLIRRSVILRREEEGERLYELAGRPNL